MRNFLTKIVSGVLGLWIAVNFVSGVEFTGSLKSLAIAGVLLGLVIFFVKPILKLVTLPLRMLTLGLFEIVINMAMVWAIDIFYAELVIVGILPLFWTTLVVWGLSIILGLFFNKKHD
ncbi:MAG: phage holin family protein [Candidatus Nealsonbacteria bacterium]